MFGARNHTDRFVVLFFALVLLATLAATSQAFAMGQAPSTCNNRYDGPITSATITSGGQTYDPIANHGLIFQVDNDKSYSVTFTIHTPAQSSQGNSLAGTAWYRTTAPGFANGVCVDGAGPDQDVIVETSWGHPSNMAPETTQAVEFGTAVSGFNYNVEWVNPSTEPSTSTSTLTVNSQDSNGNPIFGFFTELFQDGIEVATGFTPADFVLNNGQEYVVRVEDFGNYLFDHWLDTGSTLVDRVISITSDTQITAVYKTVPQPPTDLTATDRILKIDLQWNAPDDDGGAPVTGYKIERSTDNGNTWSVLVENTQSAETTYTDTFPLPTTTYSYRVSAINSVGTSEPSNTASASALPLSPIITTQIGSFEANGQTLKIKLDH